MTVRVQCLSGAVRSMLKVAVCLVVAAVTVMALSGLAGTTADALPDHPETSCQPDTPGNDPCAGADRPNRREFMQRRRRLCRLVRPDR